MGKAWAGEAGKWMRRLSSRYGGLWGFSHLLRSAVWPQGDAGPQPPLSPSPAGAARWARHKATPSAIQRGTFPRDNCSTGRIKGLTMPFEKYVAIDWSGSRRPRLTPKIQVAEYDPADRTVAIVRSPFANGRWSRAGVFEQMQRWFDEHSVLIGFDFAFAYPYADRGAVLSLWPSTAGGCPTTLGNSGAGLWTRRQFLRRAILQRPSFTVQALPYLSRLQRCELRRALPSNRPTGRQRRWASPQFRFQVCRPQSGGTRVGRRDAVFALGPPKANCNHLAVRPTGPHYHGRNIPAPFSKSCRNYP